MNSKTQTQTIFAELSLSQSISVSLFVPIYSGVNLSVYLLSIMLLFLSMFVYLIWLIYLENHPFRDTTWPQLDIS